MNIFTLFIKYITLKFYIKIAKSNLKLIKYLNEQKEFLDEIMTSYNVEGNLIELKKPEYVYYEARYSIDINDALTNIVYEKNIPVSKDNIKIIKTPFEIKDEGYYCIVSKNEECFAVINGKITPLTSLAGGLPFKEIYNEDIPVEDGYYKKYRISKKYFYAKNKLNISKTSIDKISEDKISTIKFVIDVDKIKKEGYYKVLA